MCGWAVSVHITRVDPAPGLFWFFLSMLPSATCSPFTLSFKVQWQSSWGRLPVRVQLALMRQDRHLWSGIAFEAVPFAAQLPCLAPGPADQPARRCLLLPFPVGLSWTAWLMGRSCGQWRPLCRSSQLPFSSFPSSPPPAWVQQRPRNKP